METKYNYTNGIRRPDKVKAIFNIRAAEKDRRMYIEHVHRHLTDDEWIELQTTFPGYCLHPVEFEENEWPACELVKMMLKEV